MKFQKYKYKRPVSRKFWNYLKYLPSMLRVNFIRSKFAIDNNLPADLELKIAESKEEILQALKLVHDSYVELGYMERKKEAIRFSKFVALPTTVILIAKYQEEVVGTISIVPDSTFGLPSDLTWNLNSFRDKGLLLGEVSGLAINKNSKMRRGLLFLPLCKLMHEYAIKVMKLDGLIISTTMEVEYFYTDVLLFKKISSDKGQENPIANGNKSSCCFLDLNVAEANYDKVYSSKIPKYNLYSYFFKETLPQINLNFKKSFVASKLMFKNEALAEIISQNPELLGDFSSTDKIVIANLDSTKAFESLLEIGQLLKPRDRVSIYENVWVVNNENQPIKAQLIDASSNGFQVRIKDTDCKFSLKDDIVLLIKYQDHIIVSQGKVRWERNNRLGCQVSSQSQANWKSFIQHVWSELETNDHWTEAKKAA